MTPDNVVQASTEQPPPVTTDGMIPPLGSAHFIVLIGLLVGVLEFAIRVFKAPDRVKALEPRDFIATLGNGITGATGVVLFVIAVKYSDTETLSVGENRVGLLVGGAAMTLYNLRELLLVAFAKRGRRDGQQEGAGGGNPAADAANPSVGRAVGE